MEVTQANLNIIFQTANMQFQEAVAQTPTWYQNLTTLCPSSSRQVVYGWMDRLPQLREWVGDRIVNAAATQARTVVNRTFEQTVGLDRLDIEDDQLGVFSMATRMQAEAAAKWPDVITAQFFRDAATLNVVSNKQVINNAGYDGVPCYSTVHPLLGLVDGSTFSGSGSTTQSNLFVNTALTWDNYVSVRTSMMSFKGADGFPLNVMPNLLVVPPQLESVAKLILEADSVPSTTATSSAAGQAAMTNTYKGTAKIQVVPELADKPNNWWLFDTSRVVRPFIWQLRQAPRFTPATDPASWNVFTTRQFLYGVDARGATAESLWFLSAAATSAATY